MNTAALLGHVFVPEDRLDGAGRLAGSAVDTLVGMYIKKLRSFEFSLILTGMNAIDGQTSTHAVSFVPMQGSHITYVAIKPETPFPSRDHFCLSRSLGSLYDMGYRRQVKAEKTKRTARTATTATTGGVPRSLQSLLPLQSLLSHPLLNI
jgi:hypothetical protein